MRGVLGVVWMAWTVAVVGACRGAPTEETPIVPIRNMYQQPRYNAQGPSAFFEDGRAMRPLVPGVVAVESEADPIVETGWSSTDETWAFVIPEVVVRRFATRTADPNAPAADGMKNLVNRGQERFGIYCAPCHGLSGDGDGMVARRGGGPITPPTYHSDRLRHMPDGQVFATITNGVRNMPSYRHSIPNADRWAIVGYMRALQLTQARQPQALNDRQDRQDRNSVR